MNVYFIRHGCTEFNNTNVCQGSCVPLCEQGRKEAEQVAARLQRDQVGLEQIYTSHFTRAHQTAVVVGRALNLPVEVWEELREVKRPSELEGLAYDHPESLRIRTILKEHHGDRDWHYSDEENYFDLRGRLLAVLQKLQRLQFNNILLVSHAYAIKMLISLAIFQGQLSPQKFALFNQKILISNTGISHLIFEPESGWAVRQINDTLHLQAT